MSVDVIRPDFAEYAVRTRRHRGFSQSEVSRLTGITTETLRSWEHGRTKPRLGEKLRKVAALYGMTVGEFLYGEE